MDTTIEVKIGIVGSRNKTSQVKEVIKDFPNLKPYFLDITDQTLESEIEELSKTVETLLFTDYHTCKHFRSSINFEVPTRYIPVTTGGLYEVLFSLDNSSDCISISLDTLSEHQSNKVFSRFKDKSVTIFSLPKEITSIEDILAFHINNYKKYHSIILTGIDYIDEQLQKQNIKCELVPFTHIDIVTALERSLLSAQTRVKNESQVILGIIQISDPQKIASVHESETKHQLLKLQLQRIILNYVDSIDGYMLHTGSSEYIFVSTRGIFERESRGYKFMPLLYESKSQVGIKLSIGVGFGYSASLAGKHARIALTQSMEAGGDVCYIVREDQSVFGPVASTSHMAYEKYQISVTVPQLIEQAEKLGMSATYMNKIMARVSRFNQLEYTANDFADMLNITLRSANRILLKWSDVGLVSIVGEEKATRHGRPRRLYRLNFVSNEESD